MNSSERKKERLTRRDFARMTALGIAGLAAVGMDKQGLAANDAALKVIS
jgi:hypothetical protein